MVGTPQPLSNNFQIVDKNGLPTNYFTRWAQQRQADIANAISAAQAEQLIVTWSEQRFVHTTTPILGGGNLSADLNLSHADSGVTPGTYGDATNVAQITVDEFGHVTAAANVAISGGGGGALTLISEVITSASQANVLFSAIPSSYRDLEVRIRAQASTLWLLGMQFNGDTGAHYSWNYVNNGSNSSGAAQTYLQIGACAATATGNMFSRIDIADYTNVITDKCISGQHVNNDGSTGINNAIFGGSWDTTPAAITSVKILTSAGNFVDGSVVSLYGRL